MARIMTRRQTLFFAPRNPRLARVIDTTSPTAFRRSIKTLKRGGLTVREKRALTLAKNRAGAQLNRRNLSKKERKQFRTISRMRLPKITK